MVCSAPRCGERAAARMARRCAGGHNPSGRQALLCRRQKHGDVRHCLGARQRVASPCCCPAPPERGHLPAGPGLCPRHLPQRRSPTAQGADALSRWRGMRLWRLEPQLRSEAERWDANGATASGSLLALTTALRSRVGGQSSSSVSPSSFARGRPAPQGGTLRFGAGLPCRVSRSRAGGGRSRDGRRLPGQHTRQHLHPRGAQPRHPRGRGTAGLLLPSTRCCTSWRAPHAWAFGRPEAAQSNLRRRAAIGPFL